MPRYLMQMELGKLGLEEYELPELREGHVPV
jgi:hypothetical protein